MLDSVLLAVQGADPARFVLHRPRAAFPRLRARAVELLEAWSLAERRDVPTRELSYGEQRQLELVLALAAGPRVLLLDEPTAGLSPAETLAVAGMIRRFPRDVTLLLIEHDMDVALELAERLIVLHDGRIVAAGPRDEIKRDPRVTEIYLGVDEGRPRCSRSRIYTPPRGRLGSSGRVPARGRRPGGRRARSQRRGKTTLIHAIAGLNPPRRGRVRLDGGDQPAARSCHRPARRRSRAPGPAGLSLASTCASISWSVRGAGRGRGWDPARVLEALPALRLRLRHRAGKLSGGERAMVAAGRALVGNAGVLLMDEPSEGWLRCSCASSGRIILELRRGGAAIPARGAEPGPSRYAWPTTCT